MLFQLRQIIIDIRIRWVTTTICITADHHQLSGHCVKRTVFMNLTTCWVVDLQPNTVPSIEQIDRIRLIGNCTCISSADELLHIHILRVFYCVSCFPMVRLIILYILTATTNLIIITRRITSKHGSYCNLIVLLHWWNRYFDHNEQWWLMNQAM
jgi:hypothetical protein